MLIYYQNYFGPTLSIIFPFIFYILIFFIICVTPGCISGAMREEGPKMVKYRWESHGSSLLDNLSSLVMSQNNNLANVSLVTPAGVVKVHQLVLSASSPYFRLVSFSQQMSADIYRSFLSSQEGFLRPHTVAATNDLPEQHDARHCQALGGVHLQGQYQHARVAN